MKLSNFYQVANLQAIYPHVFFSFILSVHLTLSIGAWCSLVTGLSEAGSHTFCGLATSPGKRHYRPIEY